MRCLRCKCKLEYSGKGRPRKYCRECAIICKRDYNRFRMMRMRNLGTSDFYSHAYIDDFNREKWEVKKELNKHGFKRQFT